MQKQCSHCHLEFEEDVLIKDEELLFCCKGCQGIYHLLKDSDLDSFYDKVGNKALSAPKNQFEDSSNFDSNAFYDKFVKKDKDGFSEVALVIEGIHCSACVWLNEKALYKMEGVVDVHINYTNNKAFITWADDIVKLSQIIDMIRSIGYDAFPYDKALQESGVNSLRKEYYLKMAVATFSSMNIMWIAVAQYAGYFSGIEQNIKNILNVAEWVLATPVLFYSGSIFFRGAYFGIKNKVVNMDILVATGASLTYIYSIYITFIEHGEAYFDSVSMIITFVLLGKFLEVLSKKNAADTLDILSKHIPIEVNVVDGDDIISKKVEDVEEGEVISIKVGERVAIDGVVVEGEGSFDESSLTGESTPIYKSVGKSLISGTTSVDAILKYKTTKDFSNSTISNLITLLEKSMKNRPKIEILANRLSEHFSSAILIFSFLTFLVWFFWPHNFETSFMVAISVIVIACPCALALATPVATLVGLSLGAKRGILFKEASNLESMAKATTLLLDKTGTITNGNMEVIDSPSLSSGYKEILFSMVSNSTHPVSNGIKNYLLNDNLNLQVLNIDNIKEVKARGIELELDGAKYIGGSSVYMNENSIKTSVDTHFTSFYFAKNDELLAEFKLQDTPKKDAKLYIDKIKKLGIKTVMLSGDNSSVVEYIADEVGIDEAYSNLTPQDKEEYVKKLQKSGEIVVMVGDGVNDILALGLSDISIAMGSGSDIAIDVSDTILLNDSLQALYESFKISKTTFKLIKQNLALSLLYNAITIPLAMAGFIIPLIAAISMSVSSLLVVANSMRIRYTWNKKG